MTRAVSLVAVLALTAAACSSGAATGTVGSTLSAMNGTVTLSKVIFPAGVTATSPGRPSTGHLLVAVVLVVHNPSSSSAKFGGIYTDSKLIDNRKLVHVGSSTARYAVPECSAYPVFGTVNANGSATGCDVFQVSWTVRPSKLKIGGKARAEWTIAPSGVVAGAASSAPPTTTSTPGPDSSTASATGTSSTSTSTTTGTGTSTTTSSTGTHHGHRSPPRVYRVTPASASPGQMVKVLGRRLAGVTAVTFNGTRATVTSARGRTLEVVVPDGASTGPIVIVTPGGTVTATNSFTVD